MEATTQISAPTTAERFDVASVRDDFPTLQRTVHGGEPLAYLDNAATSQKPHVVIDRLQRYYADQNSNVHRGVHALSQEATDAYEQARRQIADFLGAAHDHQIIFTRGTTESINLVASSYGYTNVSAGDEIVISAMEHHSNIVPWQLLCEAKDAELKVVPVNEAGELRVDEYESLLTSRTKLVALAHISNTLGTINPVKELVASAHAYDIPVIVDGAQATPHIDVDIQDLNVDFYCFSGHKTFGPTGIGVLYGRETLLEEMPPYQGGGDMIDEVAFEKTTFDDLPHKFEAGTPHIAGAIGLGTAVDYLTNMDRTAALRHEDDLLDYGTKRLRDVEGLRLIGTAEAKASVLSFVIDGIHPYDTGTILDRLGLAVRTGHHCTNR